MVSISKDKSFSTSQESSIGWLVELYPHSKFKSSSHFGTYFLHLGIIKVKYISFQNLKKNLPKIYHKVNNWPIKRKEKFNGKKKEEPEKFLTPKIITKKKPGLNSWQVGKRKSMILKELKKEKIKFWEICFFITNSTNLPKSMNFLAKQHLQTHNNFKDWNNLWQKLKQSLFWLKRTIQPHQHLSRQNQSKSSTIFATKLEELKWKRLPALLTTWNNCKSKVNIWPKICWKLSLNTNLWQKRSRRISKSWKHSAIVILFLTSVNQPVLLQ